MKAKYILWSMVCLLTACSQDETRQEEPTVALQVSTERPTTRGVITGTSFAKGDNIAVVVVKQNGNLYEENRYYDFYEYDGTDWKNSSSWGGDLMLTSEEGVVYACYPAQDGNWIESGHWVSVSPSWSGVQDDYLYGKSIENVSCKNPKARLRFQFALARLTFQIVMGGTSTSAQVLSRIKLATVPISGFMDFKTGNIIVPQQNYGSVTLSVNKTLSATAATPVDILVIPAPTNSYTKLTLTINSIDYDINIPVTTWEKGKQYTYPVTLNITENQQDSKETPGEKVYMGFNGDNGKPLYWSSWNLGATKIEDYGGLYGWGDPTGEHKEHYESTYRSDSYYMTDTLKCLSYYGGISPLSTIAGKNYDYAHVKWGDGWRIPSNNEFWILLDNCDEEFVKVNGVEGIRYTSKVNGKKLFFPMAPIRYGNAINKGQQSFYWLCNINGNDKSMAGTFYIDTYWKNAWPTAGKKRYTGLPIRPVTE